MIDDRWLPQGPLAPRCRTAVHWEPYVVVAFGSVTLIVLLTVMAAWGYDDPYITFRYAKNLLSGHGFVYNPGQRILSTTAPLYAILLAGLGLAWPNIAAVSNAVSASALVLSAGLLFRWSKTYSRGSAGLIAALLLTISPSLLTTFGAETCLYVALIVAGFYAWDRSRPLWAATALAVATMIRPDGLIAAAALALCHLIRRRSVPWRAIVLFVGLVTTFYAGLWLYFGSPIPITFFVKQQQGQMAISQRFAPGFLRLIRMYAERPLYWLHGALAVVGLGWVVARARHWLPLLLWSVLYFLAYVLMGVSRYSWYYAPLVPAFVVLVAQGAVASLRLLLRLGLPRPLLVGTTGLLIIGLLSPLLSGMLSLAWRPDPRLELYREIGQWLEAHTPPAASVGTLEVGIMGYYAGRPMIDFAGLVQPDVARRFTPTSTYQESAVWAIQTYRPDYVVLDRAAFSNLVDSDWFQADYARVRDFVNQEALWMTLYRRSVGG